MAQYGIVEIFQGPHACCIEARMFLIQNLTTFGLHHEIAKVRTETG